MQTLSQLLSAFQASGATRFFAKRLAPNDNSKNQFYLGGGFTSLSVLPHGAVTPDSTETAGSVRDRAKAALDLCWLSATGLLSPAPDAQLILYPKYPEVRLSGLINRCTNAPSSILTSRDEGRVLVLGTTPDARILAFAASADHPVAQAVAAIGEPEIVGVFIVLRPGSSARSDTQERLIAELKRVHELGWIPSQKLAPDGRPAPYTARNGGGYTLEAALGIAPNGRAEPDLLGWELKQFGVSDLLAPRAKSPITLMTPEPHGGLYKDQGAAAFIRRFGYPDRQGRTGRLNFGGVYICDAAPHPATKLALRLRGFDSVTGKINDMGGDIALMTADGEVAASWPFAELVEHWTRKHSRAAYVPSVTRLSPIAYAYSPLVTVCRETDFHLFLRAIAAGLVWYDPGIKLENIDAAKPLLKRRSQFRIGQPDLQALYQSLKVTDVRQAEGSG